MSMLISRKALIMGSLTTIVGISSPADVFATGTCYAFTNNQPTNAPTISDGYDGGPPIVLRYIATSVGAINTDTEAKQFAHLKQTAFSLVGKATALFDFRCESGNTSPCPDSFDGDGSQLRLMTTVDGTVIVGKQLIGTSPPDDPGSHMGINMHLLRRIGGGWVSVGPVTLECTSSLTSQYPSYWDCNLRAELDYPAHYDGVFWQWALNHPVRLWKVSSTEVPACSVFQDGAVEIEPEV